jgi:Flp pilus assembly pilin Flp
MRNSLHRSQSGQTLVEYVLLLGAIALVCLGSVVFLSGSINDLFGSITNSPDVFNPPSPPAPSAPPAGTAVPTSVEDCLEGGWQDYPQFEDEEACIEFVNDGP